MDIFGSLKDNVIRKVRNPFFGTFTIVFLLKNWQLFYSLLFFDAAENRLSRIEIIRQYIDNAGGAWCMFLWAVACTLVVLIITYLLLNIGAFISHFSESVVTPWVIKLATRGVKIVTKEQYDKLEVLYHKTTDKLRDEKGKRLIAEAEVEKIEKEVAKYKQNSNELQNAIAEITAEDYSSNKSKEGKIVNAIFDNGWREDFTDLIYKIESGNSYENRLNNNEMNTYLIIQNVITIDINSSMYYFTEVGNNVRKLFADTIA